MISPSDSGLGPQTSASDATEASCVSYLWSCLSLMCPLSTSLHGRGDRSLGLFLMHCEFCGIISSRSLPILLVLIIKIFFRWSKLALKKREEQRAGNEEAGRVADHASPFPWSPGLARWFALLTLTEYELTPPFCMKPQS